MSLDKAILSGKEYRKKYRGSKQFDHSCRNHGGCPYCENNRTHNNKVRETAILEAQNDEFEYGHNVNYSNYDVRIR